MKYVIIADQVGNPIYFDHPDGRMICLPLATHHSLMSENFNETYKELSCGTTKFVFQQYEALSFLIVSDQGEPPSVLKSQLHIVYQLMLLMFGPRDLHGIGKRRFSFLKYQKNIKQLIDTTFQLCTEAQSILVQSVEMLEVSEEIRKKCCTVALKAVINNLPEATHALLFVGTKLLGWSFKRYTFQLSSMDMFLLILFLRSTFHPDVREMETNEIPVADYTDHDKVFQSSSGQDTPIMQESSEDFDDVTSLDEGFDTAPEWDEGSQGEDTSHADITDPVALLQCGQLDEIFDGGRVGALPPDVSDNSTSNPTFLGFSMSHAIQADVAKQLVESLKVELSQGKTGDAVAVIQHALHALGHFPENPNDAVFGFSTAEAVQKFQKSNNFPVTGVADIETIRTILKQVRAPYMRPSSALAEGDNEQRGRSQARKRPKDFLGELSSTPSTPKDSSRESSRESSRDFVPIAIPTPARSRAPTRLPQLNPVPSLFQQLHVRAPQHTPMWVYFAEVQEITTLVIINKGLTGKDEEKEKLERTSHQLRDWLYKNYAGYFIAKERTHLPILTYLHHLPGLVHYIFVDRIGNRVRAPTITPLHGQSHRDPETTKRMVERIKEQVWQLVYTAHAHLAEGHTAMLVRKGDFLYSYRMWMEDDEGVEQIINQPILPKHTSQPYQPPPVGHRFFKEILHTLFPSSSQASQMKCFELFTLYLGILPTALVAKNDRALISLLLEKDVD